MWYLNFQNYSVSYCWCFCFKNLHYLCVGCSVYCHLQSIHDYLPSDQGLIDWQKVYPLRNQWYALQRTWWTMIVWFEWVFHQQVIVIGMSSWLDQQVSVCFLNYLLLILEQGTSECLLLIVDSLFLSWLWTTWLK